MSLSDGANDLSSAWRRLVAAMQGRFRGSAAQAFLRRLGALDFANSIVLFGASLLLSVLPFTIRTFGQQHRGWRDVLRYLTWAGVLFGVLVTESILSGPVHAAGGPAAQGLVSYAGTAAFFWWTMHFLLAGRVPWRRLIRAAIVTAFLWIGLELFSAVYFSAAIVSDSRLYGTIGVVFSLLTWFIAIGAVIVLGAVGGATWDQRKAPAGSDNPASGGSSSGAGVSGSPVG